MNTLIVFSLGMVAVLAYMVIYDWVKENRRAILHEAHRQRIRAAVAQARKERMAPLNERVRVSVARLKLSQVRIAATEAIVGKIEE